MSKSPSYCTCIFFICVNKLWLWHVSKLYVFHVWLRTFPTVSTTLLMSSSLEFTVKACCLSTVLMFLSCERSLGRGNGYLLGWPPFRRMLLHPLHVAHWRGRRGVWVHHHKSSAVWPVRPARRPLRPRVRQLPRAGQVALPQRTLAKHRSARAPQHTWQGRRIHQGTIT